MNNRENTAIKGYKINFTNNTITVNYTFKKASEEYGTPEYRLLKDILADFPTMTIIVKSGREKKSPSKFKNLTYKKMREYISVLDNAEEMNAVMDTIEIQSKGQSSPYKFVRDWFMEQFPNYRNIPKLRNRKLVYEKKEEKPKARIIRISVTEEETAAAEKKVADFPASSTENEKIGA